MKHNEEYRNSEERNQTMKVYSEWAFNADADMKRKANIQTFQELESRYRIKRCFRSSLDKVNMEEYDIVIALVESGCGQTKYIVYKNQPRLDFDELALLCDRGNLCFGYRKGGMDYRNKLGPFVIYTD